ncbi:MAG: porin [Leptospiraceae bacterium]|nr:porin [Leptospiraceae bacterium]MDW8307182.1 outer membrane beta-barrel protein [Leptospiraceae bacterium]
MVRRIMIFAVISAASFLYAEEEEVREGLLLKQIKVPVSDNNVYLQVGGYVDAYYAYHTAAKKDFRPAWAGGEAKTGRIFESGSEQFNLGLIQTKFQIGNNDWQVVADLVHGPNAEQTNFNNVKLVAVDLNNDGNLDYEEKFSTTSTVIKQAYISANVLPNARLTVGQFGTHIGYEVVETYQNANYMLSYLFGYGPFYHTGAKLDYDIGGKVGLMAGIVNGWDSYVDNNREKTAIGQISFPVLSPITLILNYAGGDEGNGIQHIGDIVFQYDITTALKVGLNLVAGQLDSRSANERQNWGGAAFYLSFAASDNLTFSYRGEYYDDLKGVRGLGPVKVQAHTLTTTVSLYDGHFLIRPEVKYDLADRDFYGVGSETKKDNISGLIAFIGVY